MDSIFFTIAGCNHHFGTDIFQTDMTVFLVKDVDNQYDNEAIRVELPGLGLVGYVANSPYTVIGECFSAGRLYDRISATATGKVMFVVPQGVVCVLDQDSVVYTPSIPV